MPETYVLIPGAWHGGWAWRPVANRLRTAGHRAITLTLPGLRDGEDPRGRRLADAVAHVVDEVRGRDLTDVTLVAHCWGGIPMAGAAHRLLGRLRRLVFWSAVVPAEGGSFLDEATPAGRSTCEQLAEASGTDSVAMPFELWRRDYIQDASEDVQRLVHSLLVPQPMGYLSDGLDLPPVTSLGLPTSYLQAADDRMFPRGELPRFAARLGVPPVEVPGSHEASLTRPAEVAAAILKTAGKPA